jgi:hypothetical protein
MLNVRFAGKFFTLSQASVSLVGANFVQANANIQGVEREFLLNARFAGKKFGVTRYN